MIIYKAGSVEENLIWCHEQLPGGQRWIVLANCHLTKELRFWPTFKSSYYTSNWIVVGISFVSWVNSSWGNADQTQYFH